MIKTQTKKSRLKEDLKYFWSRRELVQTWARLNIFAEYIDTKLGLIWIFLEPLLTAIVYSLAFGSLLGARPPREGVPFIAFYISGVVIWKFFNSCISDSQRSIIGRIGLMSELRFPREAAVLVDFTVNLINFLAAFIVMVIILLINGIPLNTNYLYIPLLLLVTSLLSIGVMFFVSSMSVFIRDIGHIIQPILRLFFFTSGVLFSVEDVEPPMSTILKFNPMLVIIESYRNIVLYNHTPDLPALAIIGLTGLILIVAGYIYFKKKDATFVDHL